MPATKASRASGLAMNPSAPIWAAASRYEAAGRYFNTVDLVNRLEEEARRGKAGALEAQLSRLDLVVLDELGYLPIAQSGGQRLFHLVSKLYERTSVIITTKIASEPRLRAVV